MQLINIYLISSNILINQLFNGCLLGTLHFLCKYKHWTCSYPVNLLISFQIKRNELPRVHAVLGDRDCGLDSAVSALVYAYFLYKVLE